MLHLKTARGERLEILATAILAVMKPTDGVNPASIVYDMGAGPQFDQLANAYGFVKKSLLDSHAMVNPIEVRILEPVQIGDGDEAATALREGRMFFPRAAIIGRREVTGDPGGIRARLYINLLGKASAIHVADTLDELDGEEPAPLSASAPAIVPPVPLPDANHALTPKGE
ncbi:MAG: hypothetical protein DI537_34670 [Stutzerimonas stutzeri]|nr:MAG: hypothetical protein DI537_34670 [Stutzerimonas stutzeri]